MLSFSSPLPRLQQQCLYILLLCLLIQIFYTPSSLATPIDDSAKSPLTSIHTEPKGLELPPPLPIIPDLESSVLDKRAPAGASLDTPYPTHLLPADGPPSTQDILNVIDFYDNAFIDSKIALFWTEFGGTGTGGYMTIRNWAMRELDTKRCDICFYNECIPDKLYQWFNERQSRWTPQQQDTFVQNLSKAFAMRARGTIYVMIPHNRDFVATSVWSVYEYPELKRNSHVDRVIRLKYNVTTKKVVGEKVIWTKPGVG
ncbi:hypothetical protein AJ80_02354 [Polytolypa hystricis UAMH7299]|uniref:Uncharacterized protein n=1 Tax=Polytolypa hystricis (strain UAMH7299) TaxID=1447883 RepID=A0A2B7YHK9_POLH7|nr:hypothetical protein AJ80_02354 [Polytolypa hystricis UAMH7299]